MKIPLRSSIVNETAQSLREAISNREFSEQLPGVRKLSQDLRVSIPTILKAIKILEIQGVVYSQPGKQTIIAQSDGRRILPVKHVPTVIFVTFHSNWISDGQYYKDIIRELTELGISVQTIEYTNRSKNYIHQNLIKLISSKRVDCWVLLGSPPNVQELFASKRLPCILDGIAVDGLKLPDFEVDFNAMYRHAINHLQTHKHRRICLLISKQSADINNKSIAVFREAVQKKIPDGLVWEPVHFHNDTSLNIKSILHSLFYKNKVRPTALVIATVKHTVTAMTWLMSHGVRVPEDVSIICRDYDDILECLHPRPAHYRQPRSAAKRFIRCILAVINKKHARRNVRIMTDFVGADTVAIPRTAGAQK